MAGKVAVADTLEELRGYVEACHACPLAPTRTNVVFGSGNEHARVMIIGEGPGKNEDLQGLPFVGAAGKKLEGLLQLAGLTRDDVFIANVVKCRPPGNRNPRPEEILACTPFLRAQVKLIAPQVLVTLGNFSTKFILKTERGITDLRGTLHTVGPYQVLPMFHPAAAIYDQSKMSFLEQDFRLLGSVLNTAESSL